jgi:hypothetical protein
MLQTPGTSTFNDAQWFQLVGAQQQSFCLHWFLLVALRPVIYLGAACSIVLFCHSFTTVHQCTLLTSVI